MVLARSPPPLDLPPDPPPRGRDILRVNAITLKRLLYKASNFKFYRHIPYPLGMNPIKNEYC